jgi:fluoride exporter
LIFSGVLVSAVQEFDMQLVYISIAGVLGTLSRYGLSTFTQRLTGAGFPFGTLLVNFLGSLAIGFIMQLGLSTDVIPRTFRVAATVGFMGAFTTFSTFSYETVTYIHDGAWLLAALNILLNLVLCLGATLLGMFLGKITAGGVG